MQHPDTRTADARDTAKATAYLTDSPLAGLGSYLHRNLVLRFSLGSQEPGNPSLSLELPPQLAPSVVAIGSGNVVAVPPTMHAVFLLLLEDMNECLSPLGIRLAATYSYRLKPETRYEWVVGGYPHCALVFDLVAEAADPTPAEDHAARLQKARALWGKVFRYTCNR